MRMNRLAIIQFFDDLVFEIDLKTESITFFFAQADLEQTADTYRANLLRELDVLKQLDLDRFGDSSLAYTPRVLLLDFFDLPHVNFFNSRVQAYFGKLLVFEIPPTETELNIFLSIARVHRESCYVVFGNGFWLWDKTKTDLFLKNKTQQVGLKHYCYFEPRNVNVRLELANSCSSHKYYQRKKCKTSSEAFDCKCGVNKFDGDIVCLKKIDEIAKVQVVVLNKHIKKYVDVETFFRISQPTKVIVSNPHTLIFCHHFQNSILVLQNNCIREHEEANNDQPHFVLQNDFKVIHSLLEIHQTTNPRSWPSGICLTLYPSMEMDIPWDFNCLTELLLSVVFISNKINIVLPNLKKIRTTEFIQTDKDGFVWNSIEKINLKRRFGALTKVSCPKLVTLTYHENAIHVPDFCYCCQVSKFLEQNPSVKFLKLRCWNLSTCCIRNSPPGPFNNLRSFELELNVDSPFRLNEEFKSLHRLELFTLQDTSLSFFGSRPFRKGWPNLKSLSIVTRTPRSLNIGPDFFEGLEGLCELDLKGYTSNLSITKEVFENLKNLKTLVVDFEDLDFPVECLNSLPALRLFSKVCSCDSSCLKSYKSKLTVENLWLQHRTRPFFKPNWEGTQFDL